MNLFADGMHNFTDGMIIGASYLVNRPLGIATTLAFAILGTVVALLLGSRLEHFAFCNAGVGGRRIYLYRRLELGSRTQ